MVEEIPCLNLPTLQTSDCTEAAFPARRASATPPSHVNICFNNAIESLRGSVGRKSKNHLLFVGPRGIGKTHLLSCIEDAVQSDDSLVATVVVIRFPEESNRTLSFADFLIGMCGILKESP